MRQITDKTHRIGQGHRAPCLTQIKLAGGGVQGGEQLVCCIGLRFDQGIEEGGLSRVGVADQGNIESAAPLTLLALGLALAFDFVELLTGALDLAGDHAPVQLDLGFTWATACADTSALTLQVRPAAYQAGAEVLQTREFYLQLALVAAGTLGEYFQNQKSPVVDRHFQSAL